MSYSLLESQDFNTYKLNSFMCDSNSDLATILTDYADELYVGWKAIVAGTDIKYYMLTNDLATWKETEFGNSEVAWGAITGTLSSQTDLQTALNTKEDKFTVKTTMDATAQINTHYYIGELSAVSFAVPDTTSLVGGEKFDVIFYTGLNVTTLSISGEYLGSSPTITTNNRVLLNFAYDGKYWVMTPTVLDSPPELFPVAGKIYYIDDTATGATYTFYDSGRQLMTNVGVGDSPAYYSITGVRSKDKYYIYNGLQTGAMRWNSYAGWGYMLWDNITALQTGIGTGKTNTEYMMTYKSGAYVARYNDSSYPYSIWGYIKQKNDASYGSCNDWFIPSKDEMQELIDSTFMPVSNDVYTSSQVSTENIYASVNGVITSIRKSDDAYYPLTRSF